MAEGKKTQKQKVSVSDIRRSHTEEKIKSDLFAHLWIYLVLRPISFAFTPLFINLGFSANSVTAIGLILLLSGLMFVVLGAISTVNFVIGAIVINIWLLLDCIDGNIARFKGQSSQFGRLFDHTVGMIFSAFFPLCLGLGLCLSSPEWSMFALRLNPPGWFWLLAGSVESTAALLRKAFHLRFREIIGEKHPVDFKDANISIRDILPRAIINFQIPLFLVAALVRELELFLICYALFSLVSLIALSGLALRKALLRERSSEKKTSKQI